MSYLAHYSYNPASTTPPLSLISTVRLLVGDTDVSGSGAGDPSQNSAVFSDEEILNALNTGFPPGDPGYAAVNLLRIYARTVAFSGPSLSLSNGGGSVDTLAQSRALNDLADSLLKQLASIPAEAMVQFAYNAFSYQRLFQNAALRGTP